MSTQNKFVQEFEKTEIKVQVGNSAEIGKQCNLIVTTTTSTSPVLKSSDVRSGTHITAVGSDTSAKNELDISIFKKTGVIVADSISQCKTRGEIHHALKENIINEKQVLELGNVLSNDTKGRTTQDQISVADLIAAVDGPIGLTDCSHQEQIHCDLESTCPVSTNWATITATIEAALRRLTLADMRVPALLPPSNAAGSPLLEVVRN